MEKRQVQYFRKKYKGQPVLIICDNEHNFFDNFPDKCLPIWNDDEEIVTFVETNQETGGRDSVDYPFIVTVTAYSQIQSFRVYTDRVKIVDFLNDTKTENGNGAYEYAKDVINKSAPNARPKVATRPYYK